MNSHSKSDTANTAQSLIDFVLDFLSTSSNEVLILIFLFATSAVYILFGRLGLLLIGLVSGIVLHASWEGGRDVTDRKRELSLGVPKGLVDWPERKSVGVENENGHDLVERTDGILKVDLDYSTFQPATAAALRSFTDAAIDNYVK